MLPLPIKPKTSPSTLSALYQALRDPRTPLYAKVLPLLVLLYGIMPFDLLPDFIPFIGWIDDALIIPAGIWLALYFIPETVLTDTGTILGTTAKKFKKTIVRISLLACIICLLISAGLAAAIITLFHFSL